MNNNLYEELMLWIAGIEIELDKQWNGEGGTSGHETLNRVKSKIDQAAAALASQHPLWTQTTLRLSNDSVDFSQFELARAKDKLELSNTMKELHNMAMKIFKCPPIPTDNKIWKKAAGIVVSNMIKGERSFIGIFRTSNNPGIALPCGKIEDGESAREAALREFLEETGVKCRITKDAPFVDFVGNTEVTMFFGDIHLGEERVPLKSSREGISGWYTKEEMLKGPYGDYNLKAFRHFGVL